MPAIVHFRLWQERDGHKECIAYNAYGGQGVYAVARCCTWGGVQCEVRSSQQQGEQVECPSSDHHLTGETTLLAYLGYNVSYVMCILRTLAK